MSAGRIALRRRRRGRTGDGPHAAGPWRGVAVALGVVFALGLAVAGAAGVVGLSSYAEAAQNVVPPEQLLAKYSRGGARIYDRHGKLLYEFVDELAGLRRPVELKAIAPALLTATIAVEDPDFYTNTGVNMRGLVRAGVENFTPFLGGDLLGGSGGSSITQQLAKNVYIPPKERLSRSVTRKLKETVIALELTKRYSKDQILTWYVNSISYGGIYVGIEAASQGYFGKPAQDLSLAEAALLVGIPQAPGAYDPYHERNMDQKTRRLKDDGWTKWRQGEVLDLLTRRGTITAEQAAEAKRAELTFQADRFEIEAPHFVLARVADELRKRFGERALVDFGLDVTTTLDLDLQHEAERLLEKNLADFGDAAGAHNGAFLAMDPRTGQILTYVGSRDYFDDKIEGRNDNIAAKNSPGSTLKPFTYMTAFMRGWGTGTGILDTPLSITDFATGEAFAPSNPGTVGYQGPIRADQALGNSLNIPAIKTIISAGVLNTIATLKKAGYTTFDDPRGYGPALTTGGSEITLLDHGIAYAVLANNGVMRGQDLVVTNRKDPQTRPLETVALLKVTDADKKTLYEFKQPQERRVLPAEYTYLATSVLTNGANTCITYGVCNATALANGYPSAAKTGTSAPFETLALIGETWTLGYTPELVAGTWAGNADNAPILGIDSTTVSMRTWKEFMVYALDHLKLPATPFSRPSGIVEKEVCWPSGRLVTPLCPNINRSASLYAAEQIPSDPKELAKISDTWWQLVRLDTRTNLIADPSTPANFVREEVRLVLPLEETKGWTGFQDWATRNDMLGRLAPRGDEHRGGALPAIVTSPTASERVSGTVSIVGRAISDGFVRYTLQWGRGAAPTAWVAITGSSTAAPGGTLGTWNTRLLANGTYTLRLRLEDRNAGARQFAIPVIVDNGAGAPASDSSPVLLITTPSDGATVQGRVAITGVAAAGRLVDVRTEVGKGLAPASFAPVETRNTPVLSGTIATWDTTTVEDGAYTLRVTVDDSLHGAATAQLTLVVRNKALGAAPTPTATPTPTPALGGAGPPR